jgi:1-acyl-sn-glycerol-3-phosphate acyltransferase
MLITRWSCENLLKISGWTLDRTNPPVTNCVVIAAPHTSNWDFILMLLFAGAFGLKISWMGKSNLFIKPFGYFLRLIGGISINRRKKNQIVDHMISLFRQRENFLLVVPVEGTRARANFWKSGFYHIAKGANVPILPTFLDYGNKRGGFGAPIITTNNLLSDMQKIRDFYAPFKGKFPSQSGPVKLQEEEPKK